MDKQEMLAELKVMKENGTELPKGYHLLGEEKLTELYNELKGGTTTMELEKKTAQPITETNPFGEDIIEVMIPKDTLNPAVKVKWISVNGNSLYFPVGKVAKMPKSYHEVYTRSLMQEQEAGNLLAENSMKQV